MSSIVEKRDAVRGVESPPYWDGMPISRDAFRRLFNEPPFLTRAERIDGVLVMPAASVRLRQHGQPHSRLIHWLHSYQDATLGVETSVTTTASMGEARDPEPDALMFISPDAGGRCQIVPGDYLEGAPELVAEFSASTIAKDLGRKLQIYEEYGAEEYIVCLTETDEIRWFRLRNGKYQRLVADAQGILRSEVFPGLWLDVPAIIGGDMRRALEVLAHGLATAEHEAFSQRLDGERANRKELEGGQS